MNDQKKISQTIGQKLTARSHLETLQKVDLPLIYTFKIQISGFFIRMKGETLFIYLFEIHLLGHSEL